MPYIANLFIPYFEKMDPTKELIDLVYFDGASNLQKVSVSYMCVFLFYAIVPHHSGFFFSRLVIF